MRVIQITDEPIARWDEALVLPAGEIGEITVRGAMVTQRYWARPERTALAKIDEEGQVVHRMGDVGYFDDLGRLWMCGRKDHRVRAAGGELFTIPVERVFDRHESVRQSALVGVGEPGAEVPVLLVERTEGALKGGEALTFELLEIARERSELSSIETVLIYPGRFPTDVRHNAKIVREELKVWATQNLGAAGAS